MSLLGLDLGTSSIKVVVMSDEGRILGMASAEYPILTPEPGYALQNPEDWWNATVWSVRRAVAQAGAPGITGIGLSGQMHGPLLLDKFQKPLGPAIIWADQRGGKLVEEIKEKAGPELLRRSGTEPAAGFLITTLLWLKRNQPAWLERAAIALFPKDYLRFRLTGSCGSDHTDASASGLFDIESRSWSDSLVARLDLPRAILPEVRLSSEIVGRLLPDVAGQLGLSAGVPVAAGASDQPCQAIGNGLIDPPLGSVTVGTGGQVFVPVAAPVTDPALRFHTFCHAPVDRWYLLGAMLSAGMALRWLRDMLGAGDLGYEELDRLASGVPPGCEGLTFLPYLVGERSPIMDPAARAGFVGLTLRHGRGHLVRAVLEGVGYAMRQIIEAMSAQGVELDRLVASGNGLKGQLWRQMIADMLGRTLVQGDSGVERAGVGAAMLAGIGTGLYSGFAEARSLAPSFEQITEPDQSVTEAYEEGYARFCDLYPRLKSWG
jgi:xylulokinase